MICSNLDARSRVYLSMRGRQEQSMSRVLDIEMVRDGTEVELAGRLDARSAAAARAALQQAVGAGAGDLVLRMDRLEIWDSAGLGVLVGVGRMARRVERRLVLVGVRPREARLIRASRLSRSVCVQSADLTGSTI
jgi:anti-sigma B factor antagonist